jgi:hypothetical protein
MEQITTGSMVHPRFWFTEAEEKQPRMNTDKNRKHGGHVLAENRSGSHG